MSKAFCLQHLHTGYHCTHINSSALLPALKTCLPISAFERYCALKDSCQQRDLALYLNFAPTTQQQDFAQLYTDALTREITMLAKVAGHSSPVQHLHFTGHCSQYQPQQLKQVMQKLHKHFTLQGHNLFSYSININPYSTNWAQMGAIGELGFNNINLELNANKFCLQQIQTIYEAARTLDYNSINLIIDFDWPECQFHQQLALLLELQPERIELRHLQQISNAQQGCPLTAKAEQLLYGAGYVNLGMHCYALPDDAFVCAKEVGLLSSNPRGQANITDFDILGLGAGASSHIGKLYYQNSNCPQHYLASINAQQLPNAMGIRS